jgi:hypothetical protein
VPHGLEVLAFLLAPQAEWAMAGEGITWQWTHGA